MSATDGAQRGRGAARHGDRTTTRLSGGGETHRGHVRETNQDVILVEPDLGLYAVLDGMGGANAGDVAARLAGEAIVACIRQKPRIRRRWPHHVLERALHAAAVEVFTAAEKRLEYRGMGTTVVACLVIEPTRVVVGHAGDSRAYLWRDGELAALTRDHTVAQRLVDAGVLSSGEMESSPHRHLLTRNLGRAYGVCPDVLEQTLKPGDRLLLCSDGLYGGTSERAIRRALGARDAPEQVAHNLVELALRGAASDNISAVVIAVDGGRARAATHRRPARAQARRPRTSGPRTTRR
jgi:PPM family protein phosphatase